MIKNNINVLLLIIASFSFTIVFGQEDLKLDSLKNELEKTTHDSLKANLLEKIGGVHSSNSNYLKSIESYLEAQKYFIQLNNKTAQGEILNSIGAQYYYLKNWEKAIEYWTDALKLANELNNTEDQARYMNNIGLIYERREEYAKALEYQTKALIIKQEIGDSLSISRSLNNLAQLYTNTKEYDKAIEFYHKSLNIKRKFDDKKGLCLVLQNLGYTYYRNDNYTPALKYVKEALTIARETNDIYHERAALWKLGDIYDAMKDYKNANDYIKLASHLEDTIAQINNRELIADMDAKYEAEKKDNEIALQLAEIEKQNTEVKLQTTQKIWFAIGLFLALILLFVAYRGFKQKQKANILLEEKNNIIAEKNKDITDSITYASNIQQSILPDKAYISKVLPDHFIFYKPKDIVSGDFYWFHEKDDLAFIIAADCTGHGVPGAFVSLLCNNVLTQIIIENDVNDPGEILTQSNQRIISSLRKEDNNFKSSDGMDCSLCVINKKTKEISFSGAYNQLVVVNGEAISEVKADRTPIGGRTSPNHNFSTKKLKATEGNCYYIFSDGYADQFGGPKGKKFMLKKLKSLFTDIHQLPFKEQENQLEKILNDWKGDVEQVDDILIIGFQF